MLQLRFKACGAAGSRGETLMNKSRVILLVVAVALLGLSLLAGCRSAHTTSAILYIEQEQYQKAVDVIDEGLQFNPNDPEGFYYQGEAFSRMAQVAIDENDFLRAKGSYEEAYAKYTQAREMDSLNWSDRVAEALEINYVNAKRQGQQMWRDENYEEAEGFYRLAFAALPDSLGAIRDIASMKIQQAEKVQSQEDGAETAKDFRTEALALLDQVLVSRPEAYRLRADKAYVLTQLDRTDAAQEIYDALLVEHGDDPELLLDVVGLYSKQKRYADAGDLFLRVADIFLNDDDPQNDAQLKGMYTEAGFNYQNAVDYPRAIGAFNMANERDVNDTNIMTSRVLLNLQYGQALLTQSAEVMIDDPARSTELETEAKTYLQRAVDVGNALVNIDPNNADGYYYLSQAQSSLGDAASALQNLTSYNELTGNQ